MCGGVCIYNVRPLPLCSRYRLDIFFPADGACFHPCSVQVLVILFLRPPPPVSCGGIPV